MSERLSAVLWNPQQGHQVLSQAWTHAKNMLMAGHRLTLELKPQTRSNEQNALLHAALTDVAKQCEWAGRKWDVESWKRLMTAAWCRTRKEGVQIVPAIDGEGFDVLYRRTSKLSTAECSELCEFVFAWGSEHGVEWTEREGMTA